MRGQESLRFGVLDALCEERTREVAHESQRPIFLVV
jgi:hypothetical protein